MPAGDISKKLKANVRTILDEVVSSDSTAFFKDVEVYKALTNAQREVIKALYDKFLKTGLLSEALSTIEAGESSAISIVSGKGSLPDGFLYALTARYVQSIGTKGARRIHRTDGFTTRYTDNFYSTPSTFDPAFWIENGKINFLPSTGLQAYLTYLKAPVDSDDDNDPEISPLAFPSMINYAAGELLSKEKVQESMAQSQLNYKLFYETIDKL